jgi:adenosylhomocysteine nucleosidase
MKMLKNPIFIILISADAEWKVVKNYYSTIKAQESPYGAWFRSQLACSPDCLLPVIFFHGGWGKVAAAGSTQYVIDRWHPPLIINIGTCGGIEGGIEREEIVLADKTLIYDIYEQMGDANEHLDFYTTHLDLSWLPETLPIPVRRTLLVSGDRDLFCEQVASLKSRFGACAGDWESGAIAWVAARNQTELLILRGVTDLVSEKGGEAYGNLAYFQQNTEKMMRRLLATLPQWLMAYQRGKFN